MKNLLLAFIIITGLAACNSEQNPEIQNRDIQLLSDSTVYKNSNIYSDTMASVQTTEKPVEKVRAPRVAKRNQTVVNNTPIKSNTDPVYTPEKNTEVIPTVVTPPIASEPVKNTEGANSGVKGNTETANTGTNVEKKKGWNKATQGAVIGGAAGAVGGAILSKKKGLGAVIGGVVGAAGGYILGKKADKKDSVEVIQ